MERITKDTTWVNLLSSAPSNRLGFLGIYTVRHMMEAIKRRKLYKFDQVRWAFVKPLENDRYEPSPRHIGCKSWSIIFNALEQVGFDWKQCRGKRLDAEYYRKNNIFADEEIGEIAIDEEWFKGRPQRLYGLDIISITSAEGWSALFSARDYSDWYEIPLASWALVETKTARERYFTGLYPTLREMSGEIECCYSSKHFIGYKREGEDWPDEKEMSGRVQAIKHAHEEDAEEAKRKKE